MFVLKLIVGILSIVISVKIGIDKANKRKKEPVGTLFSWDKPCGENYFSASFLAITSTPL